MNKPKPEHLPGQKAATRAGAEGGRIPIGLMAFTAVICMAAGFLLHDRIEALLSREALDTSATPAPDQAEQSRAVERKILYWHDPMHPEYRSEKPGKAPDCGMDLVPVYAEEEEAGARPAGAFLVTPEKQQLIGVQYGEVERRALSRTIRAVATLAVDETRISRIHSKFDGWIEKVYVDFVGKQIEPRQPLLSIYSPELVATQEEYLLALRGREKLGTSRFSEVASGSDTLLDAARRRLELWDISADQIANLEKTRKPSKALTLYSDHRGFVLTRNAYEGQRITPETELYAVADLSRLWAIAEIYEFEAADIRLGQRALMTLSYLPGQTFHGRVTYIYPQVDSATRTLRVRAEFANPDFVLKPDMFANIDLRVDYGTRLAIPRESVLDSGTEQIVFVSLPGGYFAPRRVVLGPPVDGWMTVQSGLVEGERIVTSGNFLIDSESRLKAAILGMGSPAADPDVKVTQPAVPAMDHSQHDHPMPAPKPPEMDHSKHQKKPESPEHD